MALHILIMDALKLGKGAWMRKFMIHEYVYKNSKTVEYNHPFSAETTGRYLRKLAQNDMIERKLESRGGVRIVFYRLVV